MKKTNKLIFIILFSVFCFGIDITVLAQAVYPDSSVLQPIQTGVHPNISGSVNSSTNVKQDTANNFLGNPENDDYSNQTNLGTNNSNGENVKKYSKMILFFCIGMVFILIFFFVSKRNEN